MAITVAAALQAGRNKLGVKVEDPEFTVAKLLETLNDVVGEFHQDLTRTKADWLLTDATVQADSADSRVYTLASQTPAITAIDTIRGCRLDDANGALLDQRPRTHLDDYAGPAYALLGTPPDQRLETSRDIPAGRALFLRYVAGPPILQQNGVIPGWIPDRFQVLLGLKIASQMFSMGGEQQFPADQARLMESRTADLWDYWAFTSPTALMRNDQSEGIAPFLF